MRVHVAAVMAGLIGSLGCSGGSSTPDAGSPDAGKPAVDSGVDSTIAAAIGGSVNGAITVEAIVTAQAGIPNDYPQWYIEDPAGGPNSGIVVYCDPDKSACSSPTSPQAPGLQALVIVTGSISTYQGQRQIVPTAQVVLSTDAGLPPVPTIDISELNPSGNSQYRGVLVKYDATPLTVDDVKPAVLVDTDSACETPGPDGGLPDGGQPKCSPLCTPPLYSGFRANDGAGHEVYVEAPFFYTDPLQNSPECLSQSGAVPVTVGDQFTSIQGILDVDPYGGVQYIAPVVPSDYALMP